MKKISKILSVALVFILLFSLVVFGEESLPVNTFPTTEKVNSIIEEQRPAQEAYEQILDTFSTTRDGNIIYPEDFGGTYYKDGYLYVNIVKGSEKVILNYQNTVKNAGIIKVQTVSHSYNKLEDLMMDIAPLRFDGVIGLEIDVFTNTVRILVNQNNDLEEVKTTVLNELSKNYESDELPLSFTSSEVSIPTSNIWGGDGITNGTVGICGTWQGSPAILTAGHVVNVGSSYTHSPTGIRMGSGVYSQYRTDELYEHGVISMTSSSLSLTNRVHNNSNYTSITSTLRNGSGLVGTIVCRYGKNTDFSLLEIKSTNTVAHYNTGVSIYGLMRGVTTQGNLRKGDSGGPIYLGHVLYGVNSGGSVDGYVGGNVYFSPIYAVPSSFIVKTN